MAFVSDLTIVQAGHVLRRLYPDVANRGPLKESVKIKRPNLRVTFPGIQEQADALFILESLTNRMVLRGQMLLDSNQDVIMFLMLPLGSKILFAGDLGLSLGDLLSTIL